MDPGGNGRRSNRGRQRLRANSEKRLVHPTPATQEIYNRYRNRLEHTRWRSHLSPAPNPTLLSPGAPSDGGSSYEDDARSDVSEGDDLNNTSRPALGVTPTADAGVPAAGGQRTRGRRRQPLSKVIKFEAAVVRKLNLACDAHRRRRVKCTCNDLSLFEEAWEHSRAPPTASRQQELAPRQRTELPDTDDYLGDFQHNELVPGPHVPQLQIFDPEGIDLSVGAVPRASTRNFLSQFEESILPSGRIIASASSDDSTPLWIASSLPDTPHQSCFDGVIAVEHRDRHGYWWVCQFCRTSLDTMSMARAHYRERHLQPPWDDDRIYRLRCASCCTTSELYDFSLGPPRGFCPATREQLHAWQLLASVNTTAYSATGSEAITGIDSGWSNFFPPSSVSSNPSPFMDHDDGSQIQFHHDSGTRIEGHTWWQHVLRRSDNKCVSVVVVRGSNETDATHLVLLPKLFQPHPPEVRHISGRKPGVKFHHHHHQHLYASRFMTFATTTINDFAQPVCKILAGIAETVLSLVITTTMVIAMILRLRRPRIARARFPATA